MARKSARFEPFLSYEHIKIYEIGIMKFWLKSFFAVSKMRADTGEIIMRKLNKLILLFVIIVLVAMAFVACDIFKGSQDGNKDGVTFTITFDTQGGSEVKPLVLKEGETINLPNNPTKDGYIFDGWYLSDEFIEKFNATQTISSNITVYAKWKEDSGNQDEKQTYTITFDTQGGSEVKPLVLKEGETINLPSNPTKDGFLFASWYLDSSFVNKFVNNGKVSSNITLYAKWVADDCEHTPVIDAAVAPTCTKTGLTEGSHCSKCEAILIQQEEIAELGHIGGQATCTEKAICTRCHEEYGNLLVHDYGELIAQVDSTCSATGMQAHYECSKCHKVFKNDENKTETIVESLVIAKNPNAHNFGEWHDEVPSICSATGTKGYKTCLYCGKHYENDGVTKITDLVIPIDNNAHSFGGWVKDENADTHTRVCAHNGEHTQTEDCHGGEATCSEKATCEVCHARYGNLLSHNYQNGVCTTCGDRHASVGLEYSFNSDKSGYIVTGIGTCDDNDIIIPSEYNSKPVTSIGDSAFRGCTGLTSITIPDSVTSIGNSAFSECKGLTSVTIGSGVTSIGSSAFFACYKLIEVYNKSFLTIRARSFDNGYVAYYAKNIYTAEDGSKLSTDDNGYVIYTDGAEKILVSYKGTETELTLPSDITQINQYAFHYTGLTSVVIPDSVTSIGDFAFRGCTGLTSITIPDSVTSIGSFAFSNCTRLTSVTIGSGVTSIGDSAFGDCKGLTSITIPDSVTTIGSYAFHWCTGLISVTIGNSLTSIGKEIFSGCYRLIELYNKSSLNLNMSGYFLGVVVINMYTQEGGSKLSTDENGYVIYLGGAEKILVAYTGTETELTLPSGITQINQYAFSECSGLTSIKIPDSVTSIGKDAFRGCTGLTSVTIPDSVVSIGRDAFSRCTGLKSITIPDSVTSIGKDAFRGCTGLTSVTIGSSVSSIGDNAFYECKNLIAVYNKSSLTITARSSDNGYIAYYAKNVYNGESGSILSTDDNGYVIYTDGAEKILVSYKGNETELTLPSDITQINQYAFYYCTGLTSVVIPDSVTSIGSYAFDGCTGLTSITIPDGVTSIGSSAFSNCTRLTSVTIGSGVTSIGKSAFFACYKLIEVYNKSFLTIRARSFDNGYVAYYAKNVYTAEDGSKLSTDENGYVIYLGGAEKILVAYTGTETELTLPSDITQINQYAFYYCTGLTSVNIPDSVTNIGDDAFYGCAGLKRIVIGKGITTLQSGLLRSCTSLESITIPFVGASKIASNGYDRVLGYIFGYTMESSVSSTVSGATRQILWDNRYYWYYIPSSLKTVVINDSETIISRYAFQNCTGLTSVTIPNSVTSIGDVAFRGCTGLASITIPESVTSIGLYAFSGCNGLTSIHYTGDIAGWCKISGLGDLMDSSRTLYIGGEEVKGELVIPDSVTSIGNSAFYGCSGLTSITIPDSVTSIDNAAFADCTGLTSIVIPDSVTSIGNGAFEGCTGLTSISGPSVMVSIVAKQISSKSFIANITSGDSIGSSAFSNCTRLTSVVIPDSVTSIGSHAFSGCTGLTSVTIGNSVTSIGDSAFYGCTGLTSIYYTGDIAGWCKISGLGNLMDSSRTLYIGGEEVKGELVIPDSVTSIGNAAFAGCTGLTSITIPDSVTRIGNYAFYNCTELTSINYSGTKAQWKSFAKESNWKYNVPTSCKIICLDGTLSI